jgi:hypothetical protein
MSQKNFLQPEGLDTKQEQSKAPRKPSAQPKTNDIDSLLESKANTDKAIAEYVETLRETLRRLECAIDRQQTVKEVRSQELEGRRRWTGVVRLLPSISTLVPPIPYKGLLLVLMGVMVGYCLQFPMPPTPDKPPVVIPAEETLEEFVTREAERLLTADERAKLVTVAEKILQQNFSRSSAIVEEFSFQRRVAGINSPAFNAFSDKWAAKVEGMQPENVETMRQIYRSLLRGLQDVKSVFVFSDEPVEVFLSFPSNVTPDVISGIVPDSSDILPSLPTEPVEGKPPPITEAEEVERQQPTIQRQRPFR